jgi:xylulokinase
MYFCLRDVFLTQNDALLGIDLGTYALKTSLWSIDGTLLGTVRREYGVQHPHPLWAEQHPHVWWHTLCDSTTTLLTRTRCSPERIRGIGVSAYVPPLVALGAQGGVLRPAILSFDQRSQTQALRLQKTVGAKIRAIAGNRIAPGAFSLTSMLWMKEVEPQLFDKVHTFVHANGYLIYRLTDILSMDYSNASMTLLFDIQKRQWSDELCDVTGIPLTKLPTAMGSWEVVGDLTLAAAHDLALKSGIPVVAGGNDSACSMLGAGVVDPGMMFESIGTSIVLAFVTARPVHDARVMTRCHVVPDRWFNLAGMSTPGACYRWFRDAFMTPGERAVLDKDDDAYTKMDNEAAMSPPGARGLFFLPYMSGERSPIWNPNARGVLFGLTLSHQRKDILRAVLEGGAYAVRDNLEVFHSRGLTLQELRITGGGAKSSLWRQIMSDVLGCPLYRVSIHETATFGAAILAGCGAHIYQDPRKSAVQLVTAYAAEQPDPKRHRRYLRSFNLFKQLYASLEDCYDRAQDL